MNKGWSLTVPRDVASLNAISRTALPGVEDRLAPLLADLSIPPPAVWTAVGGKPTDFPFPAMTTPQGIVTLLQRRKRSPGIAVLTEMLSRYETNAELHLHSPGPGTTAIQGLLQLAVIDDSREGYELVAHWLPLVARYADNNTRSYALSNFIPALAAAKPPKQVDLDKVKMSVLEVLPYREVEQTTYIFDAMRKRAPQMVDPPLVIAARSDPAAVKRLLDEGADVNAKGVGGLTPLLAATGTAGDSPHRAEIVAMLLAHGADVTATMDYLKLTALHLAIFHPDCLRLLLAAGAPVDAVDSDGHTALFHAEGARNAESVRLLRAATAAGTVRGGQTSAPANGARPH